MKFQLMQYKKEKKLYEKITSVTAARSELLKAVPEKINYKFEPRTALPAAGELRAFELFAEDERAMKRVQILGDWLTRKSMVGRMRLRDGGSLFLIKVVTGAAGDVVLECALAGKVSASAAATGAGSESPPMPATPPQPEEEPEPAPLAPLAPLVLPPPPPRPAPQLPPPPPPQQPELPPQPTPVATVGETVEVAPPITSSAEAHVAAGAPNPAATAAEPPPSATVAALVIETHDEAFVARAALGSATEWLLGRADDCALQIKGIPPGEAESGGKIKHTVSRKHAKLYLSADGGLRVQDLRSTGGTYCLWLAGVRGSSRLSGDEQLPVFDQVFETKPTASTEAVVKEQSASIAFGKAKYVLRLRMVPRELFERRGRRRRGRASSRGDMGDEDLAYKSEAAQMAETIARALAEPAPPTAGVPGARAETSSAAEASNGRSAAGAQASSRAGFKLSEQWAKVGGSGASGSSTGLMGSNSLMGTLASLGLGAAPTAPKPKAGSKQLTDAAWRTGYHEAWDPSSASSGSGLRQPDLKAPAAGGSNLAKPIASQPRSQPKASSHSKPRAPQAGPAGRKAPAGAAALKRPRAGADSPRARPRVSTGRAAKRKRTVDSDSDEDDDDDEESSDEEARASRKARRPTHRVRGLGGGTMGTSNAGRKRPKLAIVGDTGRRRAISLSTIGQGGGREKTARRVWRERLLGSDANREGEAFHDEDFIEQDEGEGNLSGIDDDEESDGEGNDSSSASDRGDFSWHSRAVEAAGQAVANRVGRLLEPPNAAKALGYEEVAGNFFLDAAGGRRAVERRECDELPPDIDMVNYSNLRAFNSGGSKGWGVCCTEPIRKGQVLGEACGLGLNEAQFEALSDKRYVFGFDDVMMERKRQANDEVRYLDLREYGNMSRLINDNQEAPNLQLLYWPPATKHGPLPRRFFLFAKSNIAPLTELSWDYGQTYARPWLEQNDDSGESDLDSDADSDDTDDDIEWTEVNWAQCDLCNKWRKLPFGPEYCAEALPEKWFCYMNAENLSHFCEDPEDEMDANERWDDPIAMEESRWKSSIEEKEAAAEPPPREGDESGGDAPPRPSCDQSSKHDAPTDAQPAATQLSHPEVEKDAAEGLPLATPAGDRDEGVASAPHEPVPSPRQPVAPPPKPIAPPPPAAPPSVNPEATSNSTWAAMLKKKKAEQGK